MASKIQRTRAAKARAAAAAGDHEELVAALNEERRGYVARGLTKRVAQVDAQLKALGGKTPATAASSAPRGSAKSQVPPPGDPGKGTGEADPGKGTGEADPAKGAKA